MKMTRILAPLCAMLMLAIATSSVTAAPKILGSTTDTAIIPALTADLTPAPMHLGIVTGITANPEATNIRGPNAKIEAITLNKAENISATTTIANSPPTTYGRDVGTTNATPAINKSTSALANATARAAPYHHMSTANKSTK